VAGIPKGRGEFSTNGRVALGDIEDVGMLGYLFAFRRIGILGSSHRFERDAYHWLILYSINSKVMKFSSSDIFCIHNPSDVANALIK